MASLLSGNLHITFIINNTVKSSHNGNAHVNQCSFSPSLSLSPSPYTHGRTHAHIQNDKQSHLSGLMPTETFIIMKRRNRKETSGAIYSPLTVIKLLFHSLKTTQESLQNAKASDFSRKKKVSFMILFPSPSKKYHIQDFHPKSGSFCGIRPAAHGQHTGGSQSLGLCLCSQVPRLYNSSSKPFRVPGLALSSLLGANHVT